MVTKCNNQAGQKLAYRPSQASGILGISNSTLYRLAAAGELDLVKVGMRASAITRESLARYAQSRSIPLPDTF